MSKLTKFENDDKNDEIPKCKKLETHIEISHLPNIITPTYICILLYKFPLRYRF